MTMMGLCSLCGAPAAVTCPLCGRLVCPSCSDPLTGLCKACAAKR